MNTAARLLAALLCILSAAIATGCGNDDPDRPARGHREVATSTVDRGAQSGREGQSAAKGQNRRGDQDGGGGQGGGGQGGGGQGGGGQGGGGQGGGENEPTADNQIDLGVPFDCSEFCGTFFGAVELGDERRFTFTIRDSTSETTIPVIRIGGEAAGDFVIDRGTCTNGTKVDSDSSCTLSVTFRPTRPETRDAVLTGEGLHERLRGIGVSRGS